MLANFRRPSASPSDQLTFNFTLASHFYKLGTVPPARRCCGTIARMMTRFAFALAIAGAALAASPEEFSTAAGKLQLTPIQHASLMIQAGGKVMYVDPAQGSYDGLPQADYILITDIHGDHMVPALVEKLKKSSTVIIAPKAVAEKVPGSTVLSNGESKTLGDFKIDAIPMYNLKPAANGTTYHEKGRGNGYVVTLAASASTSRATPKGLRR